MGEGTVVAVVEGGSAREQQSPKAARSSSDLSSTALVSSGIPVRPVTFSALLMTSVVSSDTTRSTHFRLGAVSLRTCFFTMASKARSGVKSPVLRHHEVW